MGWIECHGGDHSKQSNSISIYIYICIYYIPFLYTSEVCTIMLQLCTSNRIAVGCCPFFELIRSTTHSFNSSGDTRGLQSPRASASGYLLWWSIDQVFQGKLRTRQNPPAILHNSPWFSMGFPSVQAIFFQAPDRFRNLACSTALAPEATDPFFRIFQCPKQLKHSQTMSNASFVDVSSLCRVFRRCRWEEHGFRNTLHWSCVSSHSTLHWGKHCFQWQSTSRFPA